MRWPRWCGLLPLLPLLVLALSALAPSRRLAVVLGPGQPAISEPFRLEAGPLGSPQISLRADLPANSALELALELLDSQGAVVLALSKQAWRESGTWSEGGESGTWEERDDQADLALRPPKSGSYRLRLTPEELLDSAGQPLQTPIVVQVEVRQHQVDAPLLWFTAAIGLAMVRILQASVYGNWRQRRALRLEDSRAAIRLRAGGDGLLRAVVRARYERPSSDRPPAAGLPPVRLELSVAGPRGEQLLQETLKLVPARHSNDGDHWLTVTQTVHLRLPQRESVRVQAVLSEQLADGGEPWAIEWIELVLEDGVVSPQPVAALPLDLNREGS